MGCPSVASAAASDGAGDPEPPSPASGVEPPSADGMIIEPHTPPPHGPVETGASAAGPASVGEGVLVDELHPAAPTKAPTPAPATIRRRSRGD